MSGFSPHKLVAAALVYAFCMVAPVFGAQVDYFLKIDGVEGESTAQGFEGAVMVQAFGADIAAPARAAGAGGGGGAGKVSVQDISFTTMMSKATPKLMLACATGKHIKEATLTCRKAGGNQETYLVIKMKDVLVSSYQLGGTTEDVVPVDSFSLNFGKVEYEFTFQGVPGTPPTTETIEFDLTTKPARGGR